MSKFPKPLFLLPLTLLLLAGGCDDGKSESAIATVTAAAASLQPQDPELAAIYQRSCKVCHTSAGTGAPMTGDTDAWAPRMAKGMDTLLDNVINGSGGMPPLGLCMDCDAEQFEALINFMAK